MAESTAPYTLREYVTADGDADSDHDRDLVDFANFQNCFGGTSQDLPSECRIFDLTVDNAADESDFAEVLPLLTGP